MWLAGVSVRVCVCVYVERGGLLLWEFACSSPSPSRKCLSSVPVGRQGPSRCWRPLHISATTRPCPSEDSGQHGNAAPMQVRKQKLVLQLSTKQKKKKNPIQNANARQWPESPGARTRGRLDGAMRAGRPGSGAQSADVCKCTFMIDANHSPTRAAPRKIHKTQVVPPRISSQRGR
jgi:hypothetical protein